MSAASGLKRRRAVGEIRTLDSSDEDAGLTAPQQQQPRAPAPGPKSAIELLLGDRQRPQPPPMAGKVRDNRRRAAPKPAAGTGARKRKPPPLPPRPAAPALPTEEPAEGSSTVGTGELWVEKHAPRSEAGLIVHKQKVEEVRHWLRQQLATAGNAAAAGGVPAAVSRVLIVSGPPGCGKSAVVATLATAVGFDLAEWRTPTPTLWEEAQYQRLGAPQYQSKLDAFDEFVLRAKMPALALFRPPPPQQQQPGRVGPPSTSSRGSAQQQQQQQQQQQPEEQRGPLRLPARPLRPKLVLLEDLPHASGADQRQRLVAALRDLASTARFPVVLCVTEASGRAQQEKGALGGASSGPSGLPKDLAAVLEAAKAATISFNPLTALNIAKALKAVLAKEGRALAADQVAAIAEHADGDLRNALSTLQFVCTGAAAAPPPPAKRKKGRGKQSKSDEAAGGGGAAVERGAGGGMASFMLRDTSLSLFHGLGKLLYNKRLPSPQAAAPSSDNAGARPPPWTLRPLMDNFDPEAVLAGAGLGAGSVAAFLHENLHNFVEDGQIWDLAGCMDNLSAADVIASSVKYGGGEGLLVEDDMPAGPLADAAAASVAARGVCFCNAHPAARRWLPLRAPALFTVQRGVAANQRELASAAGAGRVVHGGAGGLEGATRVAAELLPHLRRIAPAAPGDASLVLQQPAQWTRYWNGQLHVTRAHRGAGNAAAGVDVAPPPQAEGDWIEDPDG